MYCISILLHVGSVAVRSRQVGQAAAHSTAREPTAQQSAAHSLGAVHQLLGRDVQGVALKQAGEAQYCAHGTRDACKRDGKQEIERARTDCTHSGVEHADAATWQAEHRQDMAIQAVSTDVAPDLGLDMPGVKQRVEAMEDRGAGTQEEDADGRN